MAAKSISWILIAGGLGLGGFGLYNYFEGQIGQREAASEWKSSSTNPDVGNPPPVTEEEEPVPQKLPTKPLPYYDPYRPGQTVAKLTLPGVSKPLFVVEGTDQKELRLGPGHMPGTALPGVTGNCVIAGHRDTHFRALEGIQKGDKVELETKYGRFTYQVRSMEIVSPTNVSSLFPTKDAVLHLVTCYPFQYVGHAPKRMVIEAALMRDGEKPGM